MPLVLNAGVLGAQTSSTPVPRASAASPGAFSLGVGLDALNPLDGGVAIRGPAGRVTYDRPLGRQGLGMQVSASYLALRPTGTATTREGHAAGLGAALTYTSGRAGVRPYVLGGGGVEYVAAVQSRGRSAAPPGSTVDEQIASLIHYQVPDRGIRAAGTGGLGILARLGSGWAFAEARMTVYTPRTLSSLHSTIPVYVGFRF